MISLCKVIESGAMPLLEELDLAYNRIGDDGMMAARLARRPRASTNHASIWTATTQQRQARKRCAILPRPVASRLISGTCVLSLYPPQKVGFATSFCQILVGVVLHIAAVVSASRQHTAQQEPAGLACYRDLVLVRALNTYRQLAPFWASSPCGW